MPPTLAEAPVLALRERAEHDHAVGQPGRDGGRAIGHRRRAAATTAAPLHGGRAQAVDAQRGRQPRGLAAVVAVRREAVDLARIEACVGAGGEDGLERELELRVGRLAVAVVGRLADADHGDPAAQCAGGHAGVPAGSCRSAGGPKAPARASAAKRCSS